MANTKKNALAELAGRMGDGYVSLVVNGKQLATFSISVFPELNKVRRIIEEVAKVEDFEENGVTYVKVGMAIGAIENCRAIAEDGWRAGRDW